MANCSFAGLLYDAAMAGSVDSLERLLEQYGRPVLFRFSLTSFAETPLHLAALLGHLEFTKRLLELRAELATERDSERCTPLHLAAANGHDQVVRELLRADEKPCLFQDQEGRVPLHLAAMRGRVPVVRELLSSTQGQESLKKKVDDDGDGILHLCVKYNRLDVLKAVLGSTGGDDGEVLKMTDSHGNTVLHLSVMLKQTKTVRFLVELPKVKTEMINTTNDMEFTALDVLNHSPKDYKSLEIREILVAGAGARVETVLRPRRPSRPTQGVADRGRDEEDGAVEVVPATEGSQEQVQLQESPSYWRTWVWHGVKWLMDYRGDWMIETRGSLMMVSSIIATVTFTAGIAPPGGVWQQDTTESAFSYACSNESVCLAGTAVLAYYHPDGYLSFMQCNMISFFSSLVVLFLLISGFPLSNKFCLWLLSLVMCLTISCLGLTFLNALRLMFPFQASSNLPDDFDNYTYVIIIAWLVMMCIAGLWLLIRLSYWLVRIYNSTYLKSIRGRLRSFCSNASKELPRPEKPYSCWKMHRSQI